jgi:hypothetical protein
MPDPTPPIIQAADAYRAALLAKDAQAMNRLISAYRSVFNKLRDKIDLLVAEIEKAGGTLTPGQVARMERYTQLVTQAAEELRDYQAITKAEIEAVSRFGIAQGVTDARNLMSVAATGTPQIAGAFNVLPKGAIEQLLGFLSPDGPLYARLSLLAPTTVEGVSKAILDGVAMGSNPRVIAREIANAFGMGLTDSMRMTRTVQLYSYRESNRATYMANAEILEGWVWHADLSPRTCMSCLANHGKVFPLEARLNDHHNGRCAALPLLNGQENPVEAGTAEKWFNDQGKATQQQMMGKGKYEAWKGGKFGFGQLTTDSKPDKVYGVMKVETPLKDLLNGKNGATSKVSTIRPDITPKDWNRARDEFQSSLNAREKQAVNYWGSSGRPIRKLQSGNLSGLSELELSSAKSNLAHWEASVAKAPSFEGQIFRGLNDLPDDVIDQWRKGAVIELKNDQSATRLTKVTEGFSGASGSPDKQSAMWVVDQKSGKDMMGLTNVTYGGKSVDESEIVMRKGAKYRVEKVEFYVKGELWDSKKLDWYFEGSGFSASNPPPGWRLDHDQRGIYKIYLKEIE